MLVSLTCLKDELQFNDYYYRLDDQTPHKKEMYDENTERIHESLRSLSKTLALYRDPKYSTSYMKLLPGAFIYGNYLIINSATCR